MEKKKVILELDLDEAEALDQNALRESVKAKLKEAIRPYQEKPIICLHCGHPAAFHYPDEGCAVAVRYRIPEGPLDEKQCGCPQFAPVRPFGP